MISIKSLRMEYGDKVAVKNLHLEIPRGEVFGLIGPNGAGKTTLIRVLATLLEPTYGKVTIDGIDILSEPLRVHPVIGYMSDFFSLYENMRAWEYLDHFARCYGVPPRQREILIDQVLDLVSLEVRRDAEIRELSRGMRQRLCFAKSLLHEPKVLLLDEPASGLDPAGRIEFREILKQLHAMGRTILISSHILTEMTEFCSSVAILEEGTLVAAGRVEAILQQLSPGIRLEIELLEDASRAAELLQRYDQAADILATGTRISIRWHGPREELPNLHRFLVEQGIPLVSFAARNDNLEDLYMKLSGHHTS